MTTAQRRRAPLHLLRANNDKIISAISFVIARANERYSVVTQYDIIKSLFLADRAHLNKYGRSITFDNYMAMKDGPVGSRSYDFLKENAETIQRNQVTIPWTRKAAPHISPLAFVYRIEAEMVRTDCLSESDEEELLNALTVVKALGFSQVRKLTHEDPAYVEAWQEGGGEKRYPMSLSMLFDVPSIPAAEALAFMSKHS